MIIVDYIEFSLNEYLYILQILIGGPFRLGEISINQFIST